MNILKLIANRKRSIGSHIIFWLLYVLFFGSIYGKYGQNFQWYFIESLCMLPFVMVASYITAYAILPFYLRTRRLGPTVILVLAVLFLATLGERLSLRYINGLPLTTESIFGVTFLYLFLETNFVVAIVFTIRITKKWFEQQERNHEIEKQNLKKELSLLKSQLHPHFLFNTLNNLYALSLGEPAKTSEGIANMAELLRSVLYECNEVEIPVSREVKIIENYLMLEQLRYGEKLDLQFDVLQINGNRKIAPMLLFTFVENCFKHAGTSADGKFFIHISLKESGDKLLFRAENSLYDSQPLPQGQNGGVGLVNAQKRLNIIYPGRFLFEAGKSGNLWKVLLEIRKANEPVSV
jgi:two-component system, LytTR family, sensor kinase